MTEQTPAIAPKCGVLLCNLGTPDAPTASALRPYLKEFLSDPRVIEVPRLVWWFILRGAILPFRPAKSAKLYEQIWSAEGSPLLVTSQQQKTALQQQLDRTLGDATVPVALGMRYGSPSIASAMASLKEQGVDEIIVLPLYPQYCAATAGSTFDAVADVLTKERWVPSLHFINGYHRNAYWVAAMANKIRAHIDQHGQPDRILLSYHGTPQKYYEKGDPYYDFCLESTALIRAQLHMDEQQIQTTFQSRFGSEPWLQPYTDKVLEALPQEGIKHLAIMCPGFSVDCLETLEEIAEEGREQFITAGGEQYHYIPALNAETDHIEMIYDIVQQHLPRYLKQ